VAKIRIVTDSSAQFLDPSIVRRFGITVLPQTVLMGGRAYQEGIDIDPAHYLRLAADTATLPHHQPPTAAQFAQVYESIRRDAENGSDKILVIAMSRSMSRTWDHAQEAIPATLGRMKITVLDSMSCSLGLGTLVETAARLAESIDDLDQLARIIRKRTQTLYALFYTEAFDSLKQAGLLTDSHATLGAMLGIKPFVTIEEGVLQAVEKVRTRTQVLDKLIEFAAEFENNDRLYILHGSVGDSVRQLSERLEVELGRAQIPDLLYCPTLATFIGPEALGLMVCQSAETAEFQ
jgi:DegV family protein with EDD domain